MSLEIYRWLHIVGVLALFSSLTGMWGLYAGGSNIKGAWRGGLAAFHGIGLLVLLVSGFGMLARLGLAHAIPAWIYGKFGIWLALGGSVALAKRKSALGMKLIGAWIVLGALAAYLCIFKPG